MITPLDPFTKSENWLAYPRSVKVSQWSSPWGKLKSPGSWTWNSNGNPHQPKPCPTAESHPPTSDIFRPLVLSLGRPPLLSPETFSPIPCAPEVWTKTGPVESRSSSAGEDSSQPGSRFRSSIQRGFSAKSWWFLAGSLKPPPGMKELLLRPPTRCWF